MTGYPQAKHIQVVRDTNIKKKKHKTQHHQESNSNRCIMEKEKILLKACFRSVCVLTKFYLGRLFTTHSIKEIFYSISLSYLIQNAKNRSFPEYQSFRFQTDTSFIYNWLKISISHWTSSFLDSLLAISMKFIILICSFNPK